MVLISNGNSEIGAHVRRDLGYLICLMHLFRSGALTNLNLKKNLLSITHAQRFTLPSYISIHAYIKRIRNMGILLDGLALIFPRVNLPDSCDGG